MSHQTVKQHKVLKDCVQRGIPRKVSPFNLANLWKVGVSVSVILTILYFSFQMMRGLLPMVMP